MTMMIILRSSQMMNPSELGILRPNQISTNKRNVNPPMSRRRFSVARGGKAPDKPSIQTPKPTVQVFDEAGNDVTPRSLYQLGPGAMHSKIFTGLAVSQGTASNVLSTVYQTTTAVSTGPFTMSALESSLTLRGSRSITGTAFDEVEEPHTKKKPLTSPSVQKVQIEEQIEEALLDNLVDIYLTESEIMCFLDIPAESVSVDSKEAEAVEKRNEVYREICKNRQGNDKYVERTMQTINAASKSKGIQSDRIITVEKGAMATNWDIYDLSVDNKTNEEEPIAADVSSPYHLESNRGLQKIISRLSTTSIATSASSQREMEASPTQMIEKLDQEHILHSKRFQQSLQVMERTVLLNIYQHKLATYKELPILPDPDCVPSVSEEDREDVEEEDTLSPALELLWAFSCELTKGHSVCSMAWNKKNPDILAVGYGEFDFTNQKSGLVCVWSLNNPTWPEWTFSCKSSVTSLDFSNTNPNLLAVGLYDGTIAIYNMQSSNATLICDSRDCAQKHTAPVWQVKWIVRIYLSGEVERETLFSVSADARISEWVFHQRLECTDMMKLKRIRNEKTEQTWKHEPLLSRWAVGLCFDFHCYDSNMYLVGTEEGHIHKCSCLHNEQILETYKNHLGPVYRVTWSPFYPEIFLSCSADWTIQLWHRDHFTPMMSFTSVKKAVYDIMWSPHWATVFGVVNQDRVEIWDLGASILNPTLVTKVVPGVKPTCLLFAMETDCVLVGDSEGQVSVYKLQNFTAGEGTQVDILEDIVSSTLAS
ncbi:dynein axonemal intermediate chain 4 [Neoarius graeffei]|uniref:dynein axonemal intermediate chain 4 n=1 Tax=Neoarius graeffei TaxID=443677 RepID=UPI00298D05B7|nr:dynein axonemal intermediate chain 4 [Neoarius graeffei]